MEYLPIVILTAFAAFFGIVSLVDLLSHNAKNLRRCWFILLSFFDKEFIARTFNIHHPSELRAWDTFNKTFRKDYEEYCFVRNELREWHWLMRKYGCQTIQEFENQVDFLCKNRSPSDPQYVDEWFRFKKMF